MPSKPTIAEKDLKVTPRVAKSAAKVAGRSLKVKATKKKDKPVPESAVLRDDGSIFRHKTPHEYDRPNLKNLAIVDLESGEKFDHNPAELVLVDDLDRYRYSHSFIETSAKCKYKGYLYRMKAPCRPIFAMERGTVAHILLEDLQKNPKLNVEKRFDELWRERLIDKYKEFDQDDKASINNEHDPTLWMIEDWIYENLDMVEAGRIRPEDVEVEFNLAIEFSTPQGKFKRLFNGKIDLILWNEARTSYQVFDYKTSQNAPGIEDLARKPQFTLYQYAATQLFGKPPEKMWWYHLRGKHKSPAAHNPPLLNKKTGELLARTPSFSDPGPRSEGHPRVPECLEYAFEVPLRNQRDFDDYFNNFCAGIIIAYESGDMTKTGMADPDRNCSGCQYLEHCKKTDISLPFHVRVA